MLPLSVTRSPSPEVADGKSSDGENSSANESPHSIASDSGQDDQKGRSRGGKDIEGPGSKANDIPKTEVEAKKHIDTIRKARGLGGSEDRAGISQILESALVVLSEQKSTHFLQELIQNVDDNSYVVDLPIMSITYKERTFRIDCNEVGFGRANVESICNIGQSSKRGIGNGFTSLVLQIEPKYEMKIFQELKALDPKCLMFLKNLKQVNINICESGDSKNIWRTTLGRREVQEGINDRRLVNLQKDELIETYTIVYHKVHRLPLDHRRVGRGQSELQLAFPSRPLESSTLVSQKVYAFLPIRDYGFKFMLQADFLLTANREDIDASDWNKTLLDQIPAALLHAVYDFNNGELRYSWLCYLPTRPYRDDFFRDLPAETTRHFSKQPILESFDGTLMSPAELTYVPERFTDAIGMPLIPQKYTSFHYLSKKYPSKYESELKYLGLAIMSPESFLESLQSFICKTPNEFQKMPAKWHSHLAKALHSLIIESEVYKHAIAELEIIPLRDGQWVSSQVQTLIFPLQDDKLAIPKALGVFEIHPDAESDSIRRHLLIVLGARESRTEDILALIFRRHEDDTFRPETLAADDLISHVMFLYHVNYDRNSRNHELWFITEGGSCHQGFQTYVDAVPGALFSAGEMLRGHRHKTCFLHKGYTEAFELATPLGAPPDQWRKWLVQNLNVASVPRLVTPSRLKTEPFTLSNEFQYIVAKFPSSVWLALIKYHWQHYSPFIVPKNLPQDELSKEDEEWIKSQAEVRKILSEMDVQCLSSMTAKLGQTVLPRGVFLSQSGWSKGAPKLKNELSLGEITSSTDLTNVMPSFLLLDVPNSNHEEWNILKHLGVITELGADAFLGCLRRLRETQTTKEYVSKVYDQLQSCMRETEKDVIRRSFVEEPLVYVSNLDSKTTGLWVTIDKCIWSGPSWLKRTTCLESLFPAQQFLFCNVLGLGNANLKSLVLEAQQIGAADTLEYIAQVFVGISQFLDPPVFKPADTELAQLIRCRVFPTRIDAKQHTLNSALDTWYIPDRSHLRESFESKVPFLALDKKAIEKIRPLIQKLGLEHRLLSKNAVGIKLIEDKGSLHAVYTNSLREKARFIARLIPSGQHDRDKIMRQLRSVEVYQCKKVLIRWIITSWAGATIEGLPETGRLKLDLHSETMRLFLQEDVNDSFPPLELSEALAKFCGIIDADHGFILSHILFQHNFQAIENDLRRRGIPNNFPGSELEPELVTDSHVLPLPNLQQTTTIDTEATMNAPPPLLQPFQVTEEHASTVAPTPPSKLSGAADAKDDTATPNPLPHAVLIPETMSEITSIPPSPPRTNRRTTRVSEEWAKYARKPEMTQPKSHTETKLKSVREGRKMPSKKRSEVEEQVETRKLPPTFETIRNSLVSLSNPSSSLYRNDDTETKFIGELYVSNHLKRYLGDAYSPIKHWTSSLRGNAGHAPYRSCSTNSSTFTITDRSGRLADLLRNKGGKGANFGRSTRFHIEVITTEGDLDSSFRFDSEKAKKARSLTLKHNPRDEPLEVYVLARVYEVYKNPGIALFLDPWQSYRDNLLSLEISGHYLARFHEKATAVLLKDAATSEQSSGVCDYNYKPLKHPREIRLLEIAPGSDDIPLAGKIRHVSVDTKHSFWALSYCWGVLTPLAPHFFQTAEGSIRITASLHSALISMREKGITTLVWADAICINQQDSIEKSVQIRLLRTIYQSAKRVIAWIGNEDANSYQAIEALKHVWYKSQEPTFSSPSDPTASEDSHTLNEEDWSNINTLLKRDWFRRIWIVQELVLPSHVVIVCGRSQISWDQFFDALTTCQDFLNRGKSDSKNAQRLIYAGPAYALGQTRHRFHQVDRRHSLLDLLSLFRHAQATDERDKLFALLGLASDAAETAFNPDYDSSLEEVVRRYATCFIKRGQVIDLLYHAGSSKSYAFCSWIPYWTREDFPSTISTWAASGPYYAGRGVPPEARLDYTIPPKLVIEGCLVDSVVSINTTKLHYNNVPSFIEASHTMISFMKDYPTGESHQDIMLKLPIGNARRPHLESADSRLGRIVLDNMHAETVEEDWPANLKEEVSSISFDDDVMSFHDKSLQTQELLLKYWQTAAAFANRIGDGVFCITKRGYAGMVPGSTLVGDKIVVMDGGKVPFVMRRHRGQNTVDWGLVGECYIHGMMYGEALSFEGVADQEFELV